MTTEQRISTSWGESDRRSAKVLCVNADRGDGVIEEGKEYTVVLVVANWIDYRGSHNGLGYILYDAHSQGGNYPYVWDASRFVWADSVEAGLARLCLTIAYEADYRVYGDVDGPDFISRDRFNFNNTYQ